MRTLHVVKLANRCSNILFPCCILLHTSLINLLVQQVLMFSVSVSLSVNIIVHTVCTQVYL